MSSCAGERHRAKGSHATGAAGRTSHTKVYHPCHQSPVTYITGGNAIVSRCDLRADSGHPTTPRGSIFRPSSKLLSGEAVPAQLLLASGLARWPRVYSKMPARKCGGSGLRGQRTPSPPAGSPAAGVQCGSPRRGLCGAVRDAAATQRLRPSAPVRVLRPPRGSTEHGGRDRLS